MLSKGNNYLSNLLDILKKPEIEKIFSKGFPVQIQLPLSFSIKANITISNIKLKSLY